MVSVMRRTIRSATDQIANGRVCAGTAAGTPGRRASNADRLVAVVGSPPGAAGITSAMTEITAHHIRGLARSDVEDAVLALVDDTVVVASRPELPPDASVLYTATELDDEHGPDITDVEAEILAGSLTARLQE